MNKLYFGDNLDVLREYVEDESVDLVYLDPPFNSQAQYNVLFQSPDDDAASAQVEAFKDTWSWGHESEWAYQELMRGGGSTARFIDALRSALKESNMMAYLVMMAVRLKELRHKLKENGSLYLHCDSTASHYLKVILDGIFDPRLYRNEIIWQRTSSHNDPRRYGRVHDTILYYSRSERPTWNQIYEAPDEDFFDAHDFERDEHGELFRKRDLTAPYRGGGSGQYEWKGRMPPAGRMWSYTYDNMVKLEAEGRIVYTRTGMPRLKIYVEKLKGLPLQDVWARPELWLNSGAKERIGYPTQKPLALLDRIVRASSNEGDLVLDPFCGCGTTIEAAERAKRQWIGIDIAVHAIKVIESRLSERIGENLKYQLEGMPRDFESAVKLAERDKYQFQWWANYLFNPHALREQKKGADRGIDGELFFPNGPGRPWGRMLTSVKGGGTNPNDVRAFARVLDREGAELGLFICLHSPTREMMKEAASVGLADVVHGDIPKLQIVAIEEWFRGKQPMLPPLEHLPSAAFAGRRRPAPAKRPDPTQPQLPFTFEGAPKAKEGVVRHLNPRMVTGALSA